MPSYSETNRQSGFSMLELLISLTTMAVVAGAAFALIGSSLKFANSTYNTTDAEQGLRIANEMINRDLTSTGDGLKSIGTITAPVAFVQSFLTRTPVVCGSDPNYPCVGLLVSDDSIPANIAVPQASPAVNFLPGSDRISMLIQDNNFSSISVLAGKVTQQGTNSTFNLTAADITRFQPGEIYGILAQNSACFGVVTAANTSTYVLTMQNGDAFGINQTGASSPLYAVSQLNSSLVSTQAVSIIRLQIIQYYVDANNLLHRRIFGVKGVGFTDSIVTEHVTNFQFRFLTNLADANNFVQQPLTVISSPVQQTAVREVETTIAVETVRSVNALTNSNVNSGRQKISSTTATTVRNLQFRYAQGP